MTERVKKATNIQSMVFMKLQFTLNTPLNVGSGEDEYSDHDCVRDFDGNPFIPATSIAGLLRSSMDKKSANCLMGYTKGREAEQSRLMISDGVFIDPKNTPKLSVRDGVALNENRVAKDQTKYDYEVIQSGASFETEISFKVFKEDNQVKWQIFAEPLLYALKLVNEDKLRLGYKTNRGLGSLKVSGQYKAFEGDDLKNSIAFRKADNWAGWDGIENIDNLIANATGTARDDIQTITVEACIPGTICVRTYNPLSLEIQSDDQQIQADYLQIQADYQQLTDGNDAVLPGTSLAGAFSKTAGILLGELGMDELNIRRTLAWLFGHVPSKEEAAGKKRERKAKPKEEKPLPDSWNSAIRFLEAKLKKGKDMPLTRTKIDRFSGSAAKGSLFSERVYQGAETELSIQIRGEGLDWAAGLVVLVLKDIHAGLTVFGGEVAVGRGIMQLGDDDSPLFTYQDETKYLRALAGFLEKAEAKEEEAFPRHVLAAFPREASQDVQENTSQEVAL